MRPLPILLVLAATLLARDAAAETFRFPNGRSPESVDQVTAQLKVAGDILEAGEGGIERVKMGGLAEMEYVEQTLEIAQGPKKRARSIRRYERAEATIRVADDALQPKLRPELTLVGASVDDRQAILFSPGERLSRDELELIDIIGNSLLLDRLLPAGPLAVGATWTPAGSLLAQLLGLDTVGQSDVQCELVEVTEAVARFQMRGDLTATIHGVKTRIQLKAKYRYDRRIERIDWFAMSMREVRSMAPVAQGFDVVAQVQVRIVPKAEGAGFDQDLLEDLKFEPQDEVEMLAYESDGWRLLHSRRWFVIHDEPDLVILRLIGEGELLAQCRVSPMPAVPVDKLPTLERFQQDVRQALGDRFERFVSAGQWANEAQYRVFRVVVAGTAQAELKQTTTKVPIQWRYYLVVDDQGRRIAFAVTIEAELAERVGNADRALVDSFRFVESAENGR